MTADQLQEARDAIEGVPEEAVIVVLIERFQSLKGTPMAALAHAVCAGMLRESLHWLRNVKPKPEGDS